MHLTISHLPLLAILLFAPQPTLPAQTPDGNIEAAQQNLATIQSDWIAAQQALTTQDSLEGVIRDFTRSLESHTLPITSLPEDAPQKSAMLAEVNKIKTSFALQSKTAQEAIEVRHLKQQWERDTADTKGWKIETAASFAEMLKQQSAAMSKLGMPRTVELHENANQFLKRLQAAPESVGVKMLLDDVAKQRDAARAKLSKAAAAVLADAGKMQLTPASRDRLERFVNDDLRLALANGPELAGLQDKGRTLIAGFDNNASADEASISALSSEHSQQAAQAWPKLVASAGVERDFDVSKALKSPVELVGKRFLLSGVPNRMGWDFKTGEYDFAMHRNGIALVGKFDPAVKAKVSEMLQRLKLEELPEEEYDVIVEVTGNAKATVFENVEGDIKVKGSGDELKVTGRREITTDAVLLNIAGLHVGPVAVLANGSAQPGSRAGRGMAQRFAWGLLGLLAGLLALVKAEFPLVVNLAPVQRISQRLSAGVMAAAGSGSMIIAVWHLLRGFSFSGALMALGFLLAGLYLSQEWLALRGWLPETLARRLRPHGRMIGFIVCAIALLGIAL